MWQDCWCIVDIEIGARYIFSFFILHEAAYVSLIVHPDNENCNFFSSLVILPKNTWRSPQWAVCCSPYPSTQLHWRTIGSQPPVTNNVVDQLCGRGWGPWNVFCLVALMMIWFDPPIKCLVLRWWPWWWYQPEGKLLTCTVPRRSPPPWSWRYELV